MQLLLIRHAPAEPRVEDGGTQPDDGLRELTPKGQRRMRRAAHGLAVVRPSIDLLAASPLVRATQTAEIVAGAYAGITPVFVPELQPGAGVDAVVAWLRQLKEAQTVAAVGHEPDLSVLASFLLTGRKDPILSFGKGGAALLEVPSGVTPGSCALAWLMAPRHLRRLGR
jgi:phosphohistidine phosphatase